MTARVFGSMTSFGSNRLLVSESDEKLILRTTDNSRLSSNASRHSALCSRAISPPLMSVWMRPSNSFFKMLSLSNMIFGSSKITTVGSLPFKNSRSGSSQFFKNGSAQTKDESLAPTESLSKISCAFLLSRCFFMPSRAES